MSDKPAADPKLAYERQGAGDRAVAFGQISLRGLLGITLVSALAAAFYPVVTLGSQIVLFTMGLTVVFGCVKTRRAIGVVFPVMYLPYVWMFWDWQNWPWDSYRWQWITMWWQLPGLLAEMAMHPLDEPWFTVTTVIATLLVFFAFVVLARRSVRCCILAGVILLIASLLNSGLCLAIYRA